MKNNIVRYVAILICFASIITVFTACSDNDNKLIYEKGGKIYYRKDVNDDAYELVTDKNGVTVVDEQGNLLWKVTDANGEDQTHPVSYPHYIEDGKNIECQQFSIKCPKGWENIGNFKIMLKNVEEGLQIDYSYLEPDADGAKRTVDTEMENLQKLFNGTAEVTRKKVQVAGRDAELLVINGLEGTDVYMEVYCVESGNGLMTFNCTYKDPAKKGTFNFKAVLDSIEYRV